jgi:hypothetical protein
VVPSLGNSVSDRPVLFAGFAATAEWSGFSARSSSATAPRPSRHGPPLNCKWLNRRSPGSQAKCVRACQSLRPRRTVQALPLSHSFVLPSAYVTTSASWMRNISWLNGWPARPLSTLRRTPRYAAHDSGSGGPLHLNRNGPAPSTPCRSPGALHKIPCREVSPTCLR